MSQPTNPLDVTEHAHGEGRTHTHAAGTHPHSHMLRAICSSPLCAGTPTHDIHTIPEDIGGLVGDVEVRVVPTEYRVSVRSQDATANPDDLFIWDVSVTWRGNDTWAVVAGDRCLSTGGVWDYEPLPSERDADFLATHRFDLDTALVLAKKHVQTRVVVRRRAIDVIAETRESTASS